jgi:hypothetical protein
MGLKVGIVAFDCKEPAPLAEFWCEALGYRVTDSDESPFPRRTTRAGSSTSWPSLMTRW